MKKLLFLSLLFFGLVVTSCHKDVHDHEEELITTVELTLTPVGSGDVLVYKWIDIDGAGGIDPVIPTITLAPNRTYLGDIELFNESVNPAENITDEIKEEGKDHLFVFESNVSGMSIDIEDRDANSQPLGLRTVWVCNAATSGTVNILLKHMPDKSAVNPAVTGTTDIDIAFPVVIE